MMNCTDLQNQIDDYCNGALSSELKADCEAHLASCSECSSAVDDLNHLLASLKAMPVAGPSEGFAERALHVAMEQGAGSQGIDHHRRGFAVGFGSAAVAALALWVVVGVFPQQTPQPIPGSKDSVELAKLGADVEANIPEFSIALNEQRDIKLAFYSSEELKGAQITVQMPENVALVGFPGQRELAWKTNLAKGDNLLRLPVVATGATGGQLVAHIEYMGKVKTLKVNFAVSDSGLSGSAKAELRFV